MRNYPAVCGIVASVMFSLTFWSKTVAATSEASGNLPLDAPADPPLSPSEFPLSEEPRSATGQGSDSLPQRDTSVRSTEETPPALPAAPSTSDPQQPII